MFDDLKTALSFLTILPVRFTRPPQPGGLGKAGVWFPLVGLLIGAIEAGGLWVFTRLFPPLLAAALTVALGVILTGGLHLDGLADCCDGLFSARSPERRLEIMRDSRLGSFGALGLILFLSVKILAVSSLRAGFIWPALLMAPVVSRFFLLPAGLLAPARSEGLGYQFQAGLTLQTILLAAILPLAGILAFGWQFLAAALISALAAGGLLLLARRRIGGLTGDVLGMLLEMSELTFLLFFSLLIL